MDFVAERHATLFFTSLPFFFFFSGIILPPPSPIPKESSVQKLLQSGDMNSRHYVIVHWDSVEPSRQLQRISYLFNQLTVTELFYSNTTKMDFESGMGPCLQECLSTARGNYVMAAASQTTIPCSPSQFLTFKFNSKQTLNYKFGKAL